MHHRVTLTIDVFVLIWRFLASNIVKNMHGMTGPWESFSPLKCQITYICTLYTPRLRSIYHQIRPYPYVSCFNLYISDNKNKRLQKYYSCKWVVVLVCCVHMQNKAVCSSTRFHLSAKTSSEYDLFLRSKHNHGTDKTGDNFLLMSCRFAEAYCSDLSGCAACM